MDYTLTPDNKHTVFKKYINNVGSINISIWLKNTWNINAVSLCSLLEKYIIEFESCRLLKLLCILVVKRFCQIYLSQVKNSSNRTLKLTTFVQMLSPETLTASANDTSRVCLMFPVVSCGRNSFLRERCRLKGTPVWWKVETLTGFCLLSEMEAGVAVSVSPQQQRSGSTGDPRYGRYRNVWFTAALVLLLLVSR